MNRDYRHEAETAQLQGALGYLVDKKGDNHKLIQKREDSASKITRHSSRKRSGAFEKKGENIYIWMLDRIKASEEQPRYTDHVTLRARTTSSRARRRSKEALERRREKYFSRKTKVRDTVTILIQGAGVMT